MGKDTRPNADTTLPHPQATQPPLAHRGYCSINRYHVLSAVVQEQEQTHRSGARPTDTRRLIQGTTHGRHYTRHTNHRAKSDISQRHHRSTVSLRARLLCFRVVSPSHNNQILLGSKVPQLGLGSLLCGDQHNHPWTFTTLGLYHIEFPVPLKGSAFHMGTTPGLSTEYAHPFEVLVTDTLRPLARDPMHNASQLLPSNQTTSRVS